MGHLSVMSSTDGITFGNEVTLTDTTELAPSIAYFNNQLYIAWTGTDGRLNIMSSPDGITFGNKVTLEEKSKTGPSIASSNNKLYIAWTGTDSHLNVRSSSDGMTFLDNDKVTLEERSFYNGLGPSIATFDNRLYIAWQNILYKTLEVKSFNDDGTLHNEIYPLIPIADKPSIASFRFPQITTADITVEATSSSGAVVNNYQVTATSNIKLYSAWQKSSPSKHINVFSVKSSIVGEASVSCSPASGTTFPFGSTAVKCTATGTSGNTASAPFTVTVVDTTPPTITVPADITTQATSLSGATVTYQASASDIVDGTVATTCSPTSGSIFKIGMTTVICTATDKAGNTASASFKVNVINPFDFSLNVGPPSQTVRPGGNSIFMADVTILSGFTQEVGLTVTVLNAATKAVEPSIVSSISPSTILPTSSATVFIGTNSKTPIGTYNVKVTGTYGRKKKTAIVSVTVSGRPLQNNAIALSSYTVQLVGVGCSSNTPQINCENIIFQTPLTDTQILVPAKGSFVIALTNGSIDSVIDNNATDGFAQIQLDSTKSYKLYGRITGGNKNANIEVFSPFIPGVLTPQPLTLYKTSPPSTIDLTSLNPYILQIPTPLSIDSTKSWITSYYSSNSLPYSFINNGTYETQLIFIAQ
jgi:hypothetical protein